MCIYIYVDINIYNAYIYVDINIHIYIIMSHTHIYVTQSIIKPIYSLKKITLVFMQSSRTPEIHPWTPDKELRSVSQKCVHQIFNCKMLTVGGRGINMSCKSNEINSSTITVSQPSRTQEATVPRFVCLAACCSVRRHRTRFKSE